MAQSNVSLGAYELPTTYLPPPDVPTAALVPPGPSVREVQRATTIPSRPLLGTAPLARIVPQGAHSVLDYSNGFIVALAGLSARTRSAKIAGVALGASVVFVSMLTDYRLSLAKRIPIEAHEAIDHAFGVSAIAAPFVLGYAKRSPLAALIHVAAGAVTIVGALLTDYRAVRGAGRRARRA
ncbi:SPW repeat domain-containing protein [Sorangium sp. So ce1000]|uniref:SPW repeat domain-containing protein n=1 Tax=Sorangium sp. So ce1000 TaxID=3133325 RepID=UPI003F5E33BA